MGESAEIRVGDTEREAAMTALGEHMSLGRLDVDEYGERSAKVAAAKTRGELLEVFTDLPDPRPVFGTNQALRQAPQYGGAPKPDLQQSEAWGWTSELAQQWEQRSLGQRLAAGLVPLSVIIALVLYFTLIHAWWAFMFIPAAGMISGAILGDDRRSMHEHHRQRREAIREAHRETRHQIRNARRSYRHGYQSRDRRDLDD